MMRYADQILELAKQNNGMVTAEQVSKAGILRAHLKLLSDQGVLERVERGVYILPDVFEDEFLNLQARYKRGIFSLETALFLHDLTDRTPSRYSMTFPLGYNASLLKQENVKISRVKKELHELGSMELRSPSGNQVRAYNMERTLCDILKGRSMVDIQVVADAFKRYTKRSERDIPLLSKYGKLLRVEKKLQSYLEVLL